MIFEGTRSRRDSSESRVYHVESLWDISKATMNATVLYHELRRACKSNRTSFVVTEYIKIEKLVQQRAEEKYASEENIATEMKKLRSRRACLVYVRDIILTSMSCRLYIQRKNAISMTSLSLQLLDNTLKLSLATLQGDLSVAQRSATRTDAKSRYRCCSQCYHR